MASRRNRNQAAEATEQEESTVTDTATTEADSTFEPEFIEDLPKISRSQESGVWVKRLEFLSQRPGVFAKVHATGEKAPHPVVATLKSGKAAGVNPDDYEFAGRTIDGQGYVIARLLTDEQKVERDAENERKAAEKAAKDAEGESE